jgi:hypothetical protein
VLKKQLIRFFDTLADVLHCLSVNGFPGRITFSELSNMLLELGAVQVFAPHPIVPTMQRNTVVVNRSRGINDALQVTISLVVVQLELERLHAIIIAY